MSARILYVDDEADVREVAAMSLELDPDLKTRTCDSGAEGIEIALEWRPDLILLDVAMPGMDGPATLAKLRDRPETATIPVVFITARTQAFEVERLKTLGARAVFAKPFDPMALAGQVKGLLAP